MCRRKMTKAHEADDWTGEFTVDYSGPKNLVVRCPDCGTETGASVTSGTTIGPHRSINAYCTDCGAWRQMYPVREAERGEYDADHLCDECDTMYSNTMDADMCCSDDHEAREESALDV